MKKIIAVLAVIALTFGGCSVKNRKSAEEMPPDTPWNRGIMETDSGYYYGSRYNLMGLRYVEKSNGTDIYLCAKPECSHRGEESCTATYKNLQISNYILYDGSIYFVADTPTEETQGISLYKASLDGTSLDMVTEVRKVKYTENKDEEFNDMRNSTDNFIIHKGYAYIPYNIGNRSTYTDFIEDGFAKVNIQTGEVEMLFSADKFSEQADVKVYAGIGDYVYYIASSFVSSKNGGFKYNIKTGESERITGELGKILDDKSGHYSLSGITENVIYIHHGDKGIDELICYDPVTYEPNGVCIELSAEKNQWDMSDYYHCYITNYYDNKVFVLTDTDVKVYSEKGGLLGSCKWCELPEKNENADKNAWRYELTEDYVGISSCNISDGKVYIGFCSSLKLNGLKFDTSTRDKMGYYSVFSCPVDEVISGTGSWEQAYVYIP